MKKIIICLLFLLLTSCASKFERYDIIEKRYFKYGEPHASISKTLLPGKKFSKEICEGQILFMNNAKKEVEKKLEDLIHYSCHTKDHLLNAKITDTWWTTIFYSRSCITLEAFCPIN